MKIINRKKRFFLGIICLISLFTLKSCNEDGITESEYQIRFHRTEQLKNTFTNGILKLSNSFVEKTMQLQVSIEGLGNEINVQNLTNSQEAWKSMIRVWKQLELYNLGVVEDSFIHYEINRWETDTEKVEDYIAGIEVLNEAFILSKGSSSKGISAIEYLLFFNKDKTKVLESLESDLNFERRVAYLEALSLNLVSKANQLKELWEKDKENFTSSLDDGIRGTQNQLTNNMISLVEEIVISKLGNPLGNTNGGTINVNSLEAFRSDFSFEIMKEHLLSLEKCYTGRFVNNVVPSGYKTYLNLIDNPILDENITLALAKCKQTLDQFSNPLRIEIVNNTEQVVVLQETFNDLLTLIKVDLASSIGTTVTIGDNDGD